jgi:dipeptidyl aminopeptidase/acylaminoacyl peptidase
MAANLLAHAPDLFACAVARSGAYNRTLTPFGFQSEERTLWQAPETYMSMSPFQHADRIKKPILLIHGEEDTNTGTNVIQSERFFAALKGNGAEAKLVLLPHESHSTRGFESVMHTLAETSDFLDEHMSLEAAERTEKAAAAAAAEAEVGAAVVAGGDLVSKL